MNLKTKKIIFISAFFIVILGIIFFIFGRSSLNIRPSEKAVKITVDKKAYENKDSLSLKLFFGEHTIKIEKDGFKPYEEKIKLNFLDKKTLEAKLEFSQELLDRKNIEKVAKDFTESWFTYETQISKDYLEKIKPFMTKYFYESTYSINTRRKKDFEGQIPLKTTVLSIKVSAYSSGKAKAEVLRESFEPTTGKKYQKSNEVEIIKENNNWLVNYI